MLCVKWSDFVHFWTAVLQAKNVDVDWGGIQRVSFWGDPFRNMEGF